MNPDMNEIKRMLGATKSIPEKGPYWNSNQDREIFNKTLRNVDDCLEIASRYDGRVFGGLSATTRRPVRTI